MNEPVIAVAQGHAEMVSAEVPVIVDVIEPRAERLTVGGALPLVARCA